ncbi:GGDEF domain-containing response regulator [Crocosphaera sp. Alani8]|uniref:GGDEF domain-containing response regulator n=1 Tax=Crocosphaera sp. Alani8 TaxID=3038952 RepID=UPI00313EF373
MQDIEAILEFTEELFYAKTENYFSDLQRIIILSTLQNNRQTYEKIANQSGYSAKYIKQDIAPKLWHILSEVFEEKVTKTNFKGVVEKKIRHQKKSIPTPPQNSLIDQEYDLETLNQSLDEEVPSQSVSPTSKGNILLVDDQPQNLNLLSDLLEEQGYEVRQALNGLIALEAVTLALPDVILLDINMPDLDGYTVCQRLKANPNTRDIPVIFVSALDESWDKVKAFSVGGVDYISKPFKVIEVLARIENQLKIQYLKKELQQRNIQLQQAIEELQRLAVLDDLTQVANRRRFHDYLNKQWEQAGEKGESLGLIFCKIDEFPNYNQTYGRIESNRCLYQVAQALKQGLQSFNVLLCRYQGSQFAIVVPPDEVPNLEKMEKTLLEEVEKLRLPHSSSSLDSYVTVSMAMTTTMVDAQITSDTLIELCDKKLQQAQAKSDD